MSIFKPETGLLTLKIAYDGPPASGKRTNLAALQRSLPTVARKARSHAGAGGTMRALVLLPPPPLGGELRIGVRLQTVSGPNDDDPELRRALLSNVDGVVFVADAQDRARATSERAWQRLMEELASEGLAHLPRAVQLNKTDIPESENVGFDPDFLGERAFVAAATVGRGVLEPLYKVARAAAADAVAAHRLDRRYALTAHDLVCAVFEGTRACCGGPGQREARDAVEEPKYDVQ